MDMKYLLKTPADIKRIEYWLATTVFVFSVFFLLSDAVRDSWPPNQERFRRAYQHYSYFANYFFPTLIRYITFYGAYLMMAFIVVPQLLKRKQVSVYIILTVSAFYLISVILAITDTWIKGYRFGSQTQQEVYNSLFQDNLIYSLWLLMMFAMYYSVQFTAIYLLENSAVIQSRYKLLGRDGIYAFIVWMIGLFLLSLSKTEINTIMVLSCSSLAGIILYCYSLYAILPGIQREARSFRVFLKRLLLPVFLSSLVIFFLLMVFLPNQSNGVAFMTAFFNAGFQLLFMAPLAWYVYKHRTTVDYEIKGLQTALGRSTADLSFLRSQINPHFLFNVLNTLYGTALQEGAERTSEGIQKLGDMMRFMLRENLQEKISLTREIEYLNNYITLQKLRTRSSPNIDIQIEIEDHTGVLQIAPMLLIPFVENAFKHGISLKETSYIRLSLATREKTLFFDISNSLHPRSSNDPEKDNNGIGLNNVKQRLMLMYAGRHELSIRESGKEFFVHLTIQLD